MLLTLLVDWPTLQTMLTSIASNIPELNALVTGLAYVAGMYFCLRGVYQLKEYGELRTMMSSQTSIMKPTITLLIAGVLLYLPSMYHIGLQTVFGQADPSPLAYSSENPASWDGIEAVIVQIVQFVGLIAFVRGWFIMSGLSGGHAPHGTFGKGMTHIVGGILAMNIIGFVHVMESTIGMTVS